MGYLQKLESAWDYFGKDDPLYYILTNKTKKGKKWTLNDFFQNGVDEIDLIMKYIESRCLNIRRNKALDFGCGAGRLTQALAAYFDEVAGVDIAPSMIELARKINRRGKKCKYYVNNRDDLKLFGDNSFNLIYSNIVLQHMRPEFAKRYIKDFTRILAPGGLLIFQMTSKSGNIFYQAFNRIKVSGLYSALYRRLTGRPLMEMYFIDKDEIVMLLASNGMEIVDVTRNELDKKTFHSYRYCAMKR